MSRLARLERFLLDFFLAPSAGEAAAVMRVGLGLVALWQSVGVLVNLRRFWGDDGLVPWRVVANDAYRFLTPFTLAPASDVVLWGHGTAFALASLALLVGLRPRAAAVVLAATHASLQLRNPFILNSGDRLFLIQVALASLAPLGRRASVDAWLAARRGAEPPQGTRLGERLVALQITYVYLSSSLAKLAHERWRNGWMLRDVLASPVFAEQPVWIDAWAVVAAFTYGTLLFELAFPFLAWWRKTRPFAIAAGVCFHTGIELTMVIPIFSSVMIASYASFLSDDEARRVLGWARAPLRLFSK
jgi:hypothetical protein